MHEGRFVFAQLMELLPAREFRQCVERYRGDHRLRRFSCRDQFLAMVFAQLTYRDSLRDVETCLRNRAMFDELRTDQQAAAEAQNIEMTPSFFVGEEDIQGGPDYKSFAEILDRHLAAAKK